MRDLLKSTMQRIRNTFRKKSSAGHQACFDKEALQATRSLPPDICQPEKQSIPATFPGDLLEPNWDTKHSRSISCDEIVIKEASASTTLLEMAAKEAKAVDNSLDVPSNKSQRSKSLDSSNTSHGREARGSTAFLEIPKWKLLIRKPSIASTTSSSTDSIHFTDCVHCILIESYTKNNRVLPPAVLSSVSLEYGSKSEEEGSTSQSQQTATLHQPQQRPQSPEEANGSNSSLHAAAASVAAFAAAHGHVTFDEADQLSPKDWSSQEEDGGGTPRSEYNLPIFTLNPPPISITIEEDTSEEPGSGITVVSLEVPFTGKQNRSASVDSSFLQVPNRTDILAGEPPPAKSHRSRSVDIALPIGPDGPYLIVPKVDSTQVTTK